MIAQPQQRYDTVRIAVPTDPIWRLSVEQYHQMIHMGILTDDDPVELLEGWLVTKMPKNPRHRLSTQLTREAIAQILPAEWYVEDQEPITILDSEPEPDVAVIKGQRRQYRDRHPAATDVALLIEVSDTTLQRDRMIKKQIYARANIIAYWIINLPEQQIEVYTLPSGDVPEAGYQHFLIYKPDDTIPLMINGHMVGELQVRDLLP
jgi:Uma2 family endonuclease